MYVIGKRHAEEYYYTTTVQAALSSSKKGGSILQSTMEMYIIIIVIIFCTFNTVFYHKFGFPYTRTIRIVTHQILDKILWENVI
jgi:hypothetical protein